MTDKTPTNNTELRTALEKIFEEYGKATNELPNKVIADTYPPAMKALALFSKTLATKTKEAEQKGRTAVLVALKDWADDTEVTYNRFIETELEKTKSLKPPTGEK